MESALAGEDDPISLGDLRNLLATKVEAGAGDEERGIGDLPAELGQARPVLQRLGGYEERLFLVKAGAMTTVEAIGSLARACPGSGPLVVIVDYLQKVSVYPDPVMLNDKHRAVARHHVVYHSNVAEGFRNWVVFSLEKNRGGVDGIDFELRKRFAHACFDPASGFVSEQLVDDRLYLT